MSTIVWLLLALGVLGVFGYEHLRGNLNQLLISLGAQTKEIRRLAEQAGETQRQLGSIQSQLSDREAADAVTPPETILGHMHRAPEAQRIHNAEYLDWIRPEWRMANPVPPITCWRITDATGKLLETIPVDVKEVEAEIASRVKILKPWHDLPEKELTAATEEELKRFEEMAKQESRPIIFWFTRQRYVRQRITELLREAEEQKQSEWQERKERYDRDQSRLEIEKLNIHREVWTEKALEAARRVFPVCWIRSTKCGYDIVL
jgi:hypothetical protein